MDVSFTPMDTNDVGTYDSLDSPPGTNASFLSSDQGADRDLLFRFRLRTSIVVPELNSKTNY